MSDEKPKPYDGYEVEVGEEIPYARCENCDHSSSERDHCDGNRRHPTVDHLRGHCPAWKPYVDRSNSLAALCRLRTENGHLQAENAKLEAEKEDIRQAKWRVIAKNEALLKALSKLCSDIRDLEEGSLGVAGVHLHGPIANWEWLINGGTNERGAWLEGLLAAEAALATAEKQGEIETIRKRHRVVSRFSPGASPEQKTAVMRAIDEMAEKEGEAP